MSKKSVGKQLDDEFDIIFTPDGDLDFKTEGVADGEKDYVLSGNDINELSEVVVELEDIAPELAGRIEAIINNIVEI